MSRADDADARVLVLAPTGRDAGLIRDTLAGASVPATVARDVDHAIAELALGASALLVAEEALAGDAGRALALALAQQQPWSDLPVLLMRVPGCSPESTSHLSTRLGNVTLVDRPTSAPNLVSTVRSALRARRRQYEARAADRRKDEFIATLSHELRNPLAPIRNAARYLRLRSTIAGDREARTAIDLIERQVDHLKRLVDDLLDVARLTRGRIALQKEVVELERVVEGATEVCAPLLAARGHELSVVLPGTPVRLHADPVRLAQVLANLLDNAAKYTPPGDHIELTARTCDDRLRLEVRDDGIGFDSAARERLFTLFSQGDPGSDQSASGLGIGLSLVKALVEMHGGSVDARSPGPGRGACFMITLPLHADEVAARTAVQPPVRDGP